MVHERVIYFVQFGRGTPIKIGSTSDIGARLAIMSTDHYRPMSVLYMMPGGFREERALHKLFAEYNLRGEWYTPSRKLRAFCDRNARREIIAAMVASVEWRILLKRASQE